MSTLPGTRVLLALGYHLRVLRREQLVMPAGLWTLSLLLVWLLRDDPRRAWQVATVFLGAVLPLLAGVLAAPVLVEDPALELQLTAPRPAWHTLAERVLALVVLAGVAAVSFQGATSALGLPLHRLGGPVVRQLAWLAPTTALVGLASLASLGLKHGLTGSLLVSLLWTVQIVYRGQLSASPWARYVYLFMGVAQPGHAALRWNQATLVALGAAMLVGSALMLRREERLL